MSRCSSWGLLVLISLVLLLGLATQDDRSGRAKQSQDWELCIDESLVNIERRIRACTSIIETPKTARRLARAYCSRANAYKYNGQPDRAIPDYDEAVRVEPNVADQYLCRGNGYIARGEYDHAISDYSHAIRIEPSYANSYAARALAYYEKRDFDRAIADLTEAATFLPWQNMTARKMEAGFQFESAIAERELAVYCGELHRNQVVNSTETRISTIPSSHATGRDPYVVALYAIWILARVHSQGRNRG